MHIRLPAAAFIRCPRLPFISSRTRSLRTSNYRHRCQWECRITVSDIAVSMNFHQLPLHRRRRFVGLLIPSAGTGLRHLALIKAVQGPLGRVPSFGLFQPSLPFEPLMLITALSFPSFSPFLLPLPALRDPFPSSLLSRGLWLFSSHERNNRNRSTHEQVFNFLQVTFRAGPPHRAFKDDITISMACSSRLYDEM